jgi:arsenate-mycothiol transferase
MTWRPIVLFVGDDASSTQIAESLLRRLVGNRVEIHTAGAQPPNPGGREDQMLVMMGLNPAHEERLTAHALATSDRVIILGTSLDVARVPGRRYEEWELDVSSLEERVITLAAELTRPPSTQAAAAPTPEKQTRRQLIGRRIQRIRAQAARQHDQLTRRLASARPRDRRRSSS